MARVPDGACVAIGGSFLHRGPFAFVRELIRQGRTGLEIIKQSPGYGIDILCRAGAVRKVRAGIVAMEGNFGLAPWYRRAIERQKSRWRSKPDRRPAASPSSLARACTAAICPP